MEIRTGFPSTGVKLTQEQFNKWENKVLKIKAAEDKKKNAEEKREVFALKKQLLTVQIENVNLRAQLHNSVIESHENSRIEAENEYNKVKSALEVELGISLMDKAIDPFTFQVVDLSEISQQNPKEGI